MLNIIAGLNREFRPWYQIFILRFESVLCSAVYVIPGLLSGWHNWTSFWMPWPDFAEPTVCAFYLHYANNFLRIQYSIPGLSHAYLSSTSPSIPYHTYRLHTKSEFWTCRILHYVGKILLHVAFGVIHNTVSRQLAIMPAAKLYWDKLWRQGDVSSS